MVGITNVITNVIPTFRMLRQEDSKFQARLNYTAEAFLQKGVGVGHKMAQQLKELAAVPEGQFIPGLHMNREINARQAQQ